MKILISWLAYNNDFSKDGNVETENSPNYNMHKSFWEYDRHLILSSSSKDDLRLEKQRTSDPVVDSRIKLTFFLRAK